jgi:hypothetical protein
MLMSVLVVGLITVLAMALFKTGARLLRHALADADPPLPPMRAGKLPRLPGPPPLRALRVVVGVTTLLAAMWVTLVVVFLLVIMPAGGAIAILGTMTGIALAKLRNRRMWVRLERIAYENQDRYAA